MILHTIVPIQHIFGAHELQAEPPTRFIVWNNVKLEVIPAGEGKYRINRIISTNPFDFLNPKLQPGSIIELQPKI